MYCSSCGVAVAQGLTYCNYCGAKLNRDSGDKPPDIRPGGLVSMMVATFVMGLFAISVLMSVMKAILHFEYGPIMGLTVLSFLIMLMLEGVFIRLLFRMLQKNETSGNTFPNDGATRNELGAQSRLPIESITSVTEHTTHAFDPVFNDRK